MLISPLPQIQFIINSSQWDHQNMSQLGQLSPTRLPQSTSSFLHNIWSEQVLNKGLKNEWNPRGLLFLRNRTERWTVCAEKW